MSTTNIYDNEFLIDPVSRGAVFFDSGTGHYWTVAIKEGQILGIKGHYATPGIESARDAQRLLKEHQDMDIEFIEVGTLLSDLDTKGEGETAVLRSLIEADPNWRPPESPVDLDILKVRPEIIAAPTIGALRLNHPLAIPKHYTIAEIKEQIESDSGIQLQSRTWKDLFAEIQRLKAGAGVPAGAHPAQIFFRSKQDFVLYALTFARNPQELLQVTYSMYQKPEEAKAWRNAILKHIHPDINKHPLTESAMERLNQIYAQMTGVA